MAMLSIVNEAQNNVFRKNKKLWQLAIFPGEIVRYYFSVITFMAYGRFCCTCTCIARVM